MGGGQGKPSAPALPEKVVVVGGGYAGRDMAKLACGFYKTTLIEKRSVMVHKLSGVRAAVTKTWADVTTIPIEEVFGKDGPAGGHMVIQAEVIKIDKAAKTLALSDGQSIPYDFLILAMGGESTSPAEPPANCITGEQCKSFFAAVEADIRASKQVLVVGGGYVGTELAGEIRHYCPDVKVTVVESGPKLVKDVGEPVSSNIQKIAETCEVTLIFNDRVEAQEGSGPGLDLTGLWQEKRMKPVDGVVKLKSGKTVEGIDLVLWCVGYKPTTTLMTNSDMGDKLDSAGRIKVDGFLQVSGEKGIFAIGDCGGFQETKLAISGGSNSGKKMFLPAGNADSVIANLRLLSAEKAMTPYISKFDPATTCMLSFGPEKGTTKGVPSFFLKTKTKSLFTEQQWTKYGQASPTLPA